MFMENKILEIVAERFRVLGDPLRLQILHLLKQDERSVGALVEATSASQANVSQHLQILRQAGLVERRKEGLMAFYRIADPSIFQLCELVCGRLEEKYRDDLDAIARLHAADGRTAGKDAPRG
jgi:DNA-binding transcriptional ArsR family regulator